MYLARWVNSTTLWSTQTPRSTTRRSTWPGGPKRRQPLVHPKPEEHYKEIHLARWAEATPASAWRALSVSVWVGSGRCVSVERRVLYHPRCGCVCRLTVIELPSSATPAASHFGRGYGPLLTQTHPPRPPPPHLERKHFALPTFTPRWFPSMPPCERRHVRVLTG